MSNDLNSYQSVKKWREENITKFLTNTQDLNGFHDEVMKIVYRIALEKIITEVPPCKHTWFITGSGGRFEQGVISDQDHGIVFESTNTLTESFFKKLGEEVSDGLNYVGYPYCQGNIMGSNPLWCKSLEDWKIQLTRWMEEASLTSIRNLQIFYDARTLTGDNSFIDELKTFIHDYIREHPSLLKRLMESVMHLKNAIGPLGQIIAEDRGPHQGSIDLKHAAFIPYVNAIRLLSIKEGIHKTSTLERIKILMELDMYGKELESYKTNFEILLNYRLSLFKIENYDDTHYLNIRNLSKDERKEIKRILKDGKKLHQYVNRLIEKGCS